MPFATYMTELREDRKESQLDMAKILDISITAIKLIENGTTKFPSEKLLKKICDYTGADANEVIMDILFTEEDVKERPLACNYLAYMYLQGWNITESPLKVHLTRHLDRVFDARIIKKRENKNILIIATCDRFFERITIDDVLNNHECSGYIADAISLVLSVLEPFRGLQILFDSHDEKQTRMFNLFDEMKYFQFTFDIVLILFDADKREIVSIKRVTK